MKKLIVFFIALTFTVLSSCDSNNNSVEPKNISLTAIINGVEVKFDTSKVVKDYVVPTNGDPSYTDLIVTQTISTDPTKKIEFRLADLETGAETCYYFLYQEKAIGEEFPIDYDVEIGDDSFQVNITENTATSLKGTFMGKLTNGDNSVSVVIPNGSFNIQH